MSNTKLSVATVEQLQELHGYLAKTFKKWLMMDGYVDPASGEMRPLTPAHIAQILKFLETNNIKAVIMSNNDMSDAIRTVYQQYLQSNQTLNQYNSGTLIEADKVDEDADIGSVDPTVDAANQLVADAVKARQAAGG